MESLFNAALEAVSLSSPTGLSLPDLWQRLAEPAAALGAATLPPTMRRAIWQMITERKDDITAAAAAVPLGAEPQIVPWDSPETSTYLDAEAANIHLIASPAMQDACLGVYAARLNRFQLSLPQRQTLRILGEAKSRGALQSVLTTALGIENRNYSYVIKNLEERGLVAKCPTVLQKGGGHVTSTNLIVLTKFAPEEMTDPQARLHDGKSSTMRSDPNRASGSGDRRFFNNRGGAEEGDSGEEDDGGGGSSGDDIGFDDLGGVTGMPGIVGGGVFGPAAMSSVQCLDMYGNLDQSGVGAAGGGGRADGAGPSTLNNQHGSNAGGAGGLHMVLDDDMHLRKITTLLASIPDHSSNETDLKKELGYIGRRGHRRWRRLRNILEKKACIERFKARAGGVNGSIVWMVKLLKAYTGNADDEWMLTALLDPLTGKLNVFGEQVAELTLDRQILTMLAAAGNDGITTQQVDTQLKFNIKRNEPRFKELKMRYGQGSVVEQHINQGKVRLLRYNATPELLAVLDAALQGVSVDGGGGGAMEPPPGGYVNAVREAITAGLNEDGTNPLAKYAAPTGYAGGQDGDEQGEAAPDVVADLLAQQTTAAAPTTAGPSAPEEEGGDEEDADEDEEEEEDEQGAGPNMTVAEAKKNGTYAPSKRKKQPLTEMAKLRRQWIVERVNRENLLLCSEIGSYLQSTERAVRNNPKAVRPDKKVIQRLINAALEANELSVHQITLPAQGGAHSNRMHDVLAKPDQVADPDFVDAVIKAHKDMQHRIRQSSSLAITSKHEDPVGVTLPIVAGKKSDKKSDKKKGGAGGASGSAAAGHGGADGDGTETVAGADGEGTITTLTAPLIHGLIGARMQRVCRVHELAWKLLAARNGAPSPFLNPSLTAAAAEGKVFLVGHAPMSLLGGRPLDMGVFHGTPEQQATVLTTDEFWKALTVEDFVTCLGSRSTDQSLVQEFKVANKRMGELRRRELIGLAGGIDALTAAKGNLTKYLDIMTRMGLICAVVPFGEGRNLGSAGSTSYLFRRKIQYEEPIQIIDHDSDLDIDETTGGGTPSTAAPRSPGGGTKLSVETMLHNFDATTVEGRTAYWMSMQYMVICSPLATGFRGRIGRKSFLADCFPFSSTAEASSERSWVQRNAIVAEKLDELLEKISSMTLPKPGHLSAGGEQEAAAAQGGEEEAPAPAAVPGAANTNSDPNYLTWQRALELSKEAQVPFETVARAITKANSQRLRGVLTSSRRLGGIGPSGIGRRRYRQAELRRKRRRGGASDEDTDQENQDGLFDLELGGGGDGDEEYRPVKQRKKKWFTEEDRELLHAWATWLAAKGPDKILRWKFVKGRPRGILPISCKYRIQVLKANESIGPMMMKILEVAGGVHSRRVLRDAAAGGGASGSGTVEASAPPAPAPEEEVGEKRKADDDTTNSASKKARAEDGSAIEATPATELTADLPPLWPISDSEDATALQLVVDEIENVVRTAPSRYKHGMKKPDHARTGAGADYEHGGAGAGGGGGGGGGVGGGDRRGRSVLGGLGGRLLGPAARGPVSIARQFTALCQWARTAAAARANGTARPPMPSVSMAMELVKSLLLAVKEKEEDIMLQHHTGTTASRTSNTVLDASFGTALTDRFSPGDIKEAIAELIRLGHITVTSAAAAGGGGGQNTNVAAAGGNSATAATASGSSSGLALSNRFIVEMQPLFLHGGVFNEAHAAHAELLSVPPTAPTPAPAAAAAAAKPRESKPAVKNLLPLGQPSSTNGSSSAVAAAERSVLGVSEISGGAVAAVLSKCFTDTAAAANSSEKAELTASLPRSVRMISTAGAAAVQQQQQQPTTTTTTTGTAATTVELDDESEENMLRVLTSIKVTASVRGNANSDALKYPSTPSVASARPSSAAAMGAAAAAGTAGIYIGGPRGQRLSLTDLNGQEHKLQFSSQEEVLYQPALVASDAQLRSAAEAACKKLFTFKKLGGTAAGGGKCMDQILKALRAAGENGLTPSDFLVGDETTPPTGKTTPAAAAVAKAKAKCLKTSNEVEEALGALCRCGLVRRVTGYDDVCVVASDIAPTHPRLVFPPPETTPLSTAISSLNLPAQGTVQPCVDVPIRPWVDHVGRLKPSLWRALIHRAVSTVLQYPGVGGDVLLQSLRVVNPQHAREVLSVLCAAGIFHAKKVKKVHVSVKKSVLAACFGDASSEEEKEKEEDGVGADKGNEGAVATSMYGGTAFPITKASTTDDSSWNFFIDPSNWWQAMHVLPSSVLVPAMAER